MQVQVVKSKKTGNVLNISTNNPNEAWVMLASSEEVTREGRIYNNRRTGFLRATKDILEAKGFKEGQVLPGHIVIKDSLTPIIMDKVTGEPTDFGLRVPQSKRGVAYTPEIGTAIRTACKANGVTYMGLGEGGELFPIYRKVFYSPYPEGHPSYEADNIISIANAEQVNKFIDSINLSADNGAKEARIAELKAMGKAKRVAAGLQEEYENLID